MTIKNWAALTPKPWQIVLIFAAAAAFPACSSDEPAATNSTGTATDNAGGVGGTETPRGSGGTNPGNVPTGTGGTGGSAGTPANPSEIQTGDESRGGLAADCANLDEGGAVPATANDLNAWLQEKRYTCWARESAVHPSTGPHGGNVRTYLNASLSASLPTTNDHEQGAVAVKELYGSGTTEVTGWAVSIKTDPASANGQGWYWYETFSTQPGASSIEGQGKALCVGCHSGGRDYVLTPSPLP